MCEAAVYIKEISITKIIHTQIALYTKVYQQNSLKKIWVNSIFVSCAINTSDHKIGVFIAKYLGEFESIFIIQKAFNPCIRGPE
jgi:hypothetical protein